MSRTIVAIIGALGLMVGAFQVIMPQRALEVSRQVMDSDYLIALGPLSVVIGVAFLVAGLRHLVRVSLFVTIIGGLMVLAGALVLAHPNFTRDLLRVVYFERGHGFQTAITIVGGIMRAAIGGVLLYAGLLPPKQEEIAVPIHTSNVTEESERAGE